MTSQEFAALAAQLATMLACAVVFGEIVRRLHQPAVVGEMLGGIVLGPTVLGRAVPAVYAALFLASSNVTAVREATTRLGMLFFLFYAGLKINLSDLKALGRRAAVIGLVGTLLPIAAGVGLVYALPYAFWGAAVQPHFLAFALFVGMNLANSANPVIARILIDLGLLERPIGMLIMSATIVDDLVNWIVFAIILSDIAPSGSASGGALAIRMGIAVLLFAAVLGPGRRYGPRALRWIRPHVVWPAGYIAAAAVLVLLASAATEALGIHAFFGAFLVGVALSDSNRDEQAAHDVIGGFVMSVAPIYFVSIGMATDFIAHLDLLLLVVILAIACASKVGSVLLGARLAGMRIDREAWAVAFGLNARGATGIILAGVGLAHGVIDERLFVAIVLTALLTSLMAGPIMSRLLARPAPALERT